MKKRKKLSKIDQQLYFQSKKLFKKTMSFYIKYYLLFLSFFIAILMLFFFFFSSWFNVVSWIIVAGNLFIISTFLVIFDGIPARRIRKSNFTFNNMSKKQGIVFYNALKLRTIFRGLLNIAGTVVIIAIVLILMYW